jgi:spore germination protein GerM
MKSRILSAVLVLLSITACNGTIEVGLEHSPTGIPSLAATPTTVLIPTNTFVQPTSTDPLPSPTVQAPTETGSPTDAPTQHTVQIFLIAVDDNGQTGTSVGCRDSAVPVQVEIPPTQGVLKAALAALFSVRDQYYGQSGLYNALYQSDLQVESVSIDSGKASVYLTGTLQMGGECDSPRVQAQLEQTVLQFSTVTEVAIFINGNPLADVLSLKG